MRALFKRKESVPRPLDLFRGRLPLSSAEPVSWWYDDSEGARGPSERTVVTALDTEIGPLLVDAPRSTRSDLSWVLGGCEPLVARQARYLHLNG